MFVGFAIPAHRQFVGSPALNALPRSVRNVAARQRFKIGQRECLIQLRLAAL